MPVTKNIGVFGIENLKKNSAESQRASGRDSYAGVRRTAMVSHLAARQVLRDSGRWNDAEC